MSKSPDYSDPNVLACPDCGCPIQRLYDTKKHHTYGTLEDAQKVHARKVHPETLP